jgi:hypothetical protein
LSGKNSILFFLLILLPVMVSGQKDSLAQKSDTSQKRVFLLHKVERNGEVLPEVDIKEVTVVGKKGLSRRIYYRRYDRLTYNLQKVYPYSVIVRERLAMINENLAAISDEKERRKYMKDVEKSVLGEYEDDIRDMTITQGRLLLKLIDRETQNTSYDLIKQYRGAISAAFWQGIARLFGTNLKEEYDPYGEDALIETIVKGIESGNIPLL